MGKPTATELITTKAFLLLEQHPEGMRWTDLRLEIEASDPSFHPKTVNGIIWKLPQQYPDKVYKPTKGVFRLLKYNSDKQ